MGRQAEASQADRSYVAGAGGFSWQSVLSLVPGIWEAPSLRDFPRCRWEGEEGRPIMAPGVRPYTHQFSCIIFSI